MKIKQSVTLVLGCLLVFAASSTFAAKYKVLSGGVKDGGSVSGRISYDGTAPAPEILKLDEDIEACGGDRPSDALVVGGNGGIQNVVLSIEKIAKGKDWDFPQEFTYDQKNCSFVPRIMLIKSKMAGVVLNSDSIGHNFHTISKGVFNINKKIQSGSKLVVKNNKIRKTGMVRVKCDIHSWMRGYWVVAKTPYTVLSDADGNFSIADIPPGNYTLKIWHEKLGESKQKFEVKKGGATKIDVALKL
ncbi:MAG: carboxypeptidase regulatory-like domain-containing protein [Proteobacteria bacterium]|nr:carboxypeptidase regulatory-like domain-containing protein [Pseudomonadota bacterium]